MAAQKRTYKAPAVRVLGTVQELTQLNPATGANDLQFLNGIVTTP